VYPPQCAACRAELEDTERAADLCLECQKKLTPPIWVPCHRCGVYFDGILIHQDGCSSCADTPFRFDTTVALGEYHTHLQHIISRMKSPTGEPLSLALGRLLATQRREPLEEFSPEVIVPIPMHWWHRLRRRTNNPDLIARSLGDILEIPVKRYLLKRCKRTRTQSNLEPAVRFRNVRGSFQVRFARQIRGKRVLLVDDVLTTGATCSEAAKMLKQAGATRVAVAVIARAQGRKK
jgi:ComF family protein